MARSKLVNFDGFRGGVNNRDWEYDIPRTSLREAVNIDIARSGSISRRDGYTKRLDLTNSHSLFGYEDILLCVDENGLNRIYPDSYEKELLDSLGDVVSRMSYVNILGTIYYSNGNDSGKYYDGVVSPWGVDVPPSQPTLSVSGNGQLTAGNYQVTITSMNSDGEESGADLSVRIDVDENQRIVLSNIPDTGMVTRVYVSTPNGDDLYHHADVPASTTTWSITRTIRGKRLETQFAEKMRPGHLLAAYNGRMYVADNDILWFSDALQYGMYHPLDNFMSSFGKKITMVQPVDTGIYIGAGSIYFISGTDPSNMKITSVHDSVAIEGTSMQIDSNLLNLDGISGRVAYWFGSKGAMVGLQGGQVMPITNKQLEVEKYEDGSAQFIEKNGIKKVVNTLRNQTGSNQASCSDSVTYQVIRNGVLLQE